MQVVVATTEGGAVCGGYNPAGWIGLGDHRDSIAAFLFTWPNGDTAAAPLKLKKVPSCSAPAPPSQPLLCRLPHTCGSTGTHVICAFHRAS